MLGPPPDTRRSCISAHESTCKFVVPGVRIKEEAEIVEGEVVEVEIEKSTSIFE